MPIRISTHRLSLHRLVSCLTRMLRSSSSSSTPSMLPLRYRAIVRHDLPEQLLPQRRRARRPALGRRPASSQGGGAGQPAVDCRLGATRGRSAGWLSVAFFDSGQRAKHAARGTRRDWSYSEATKRHRGVSRSRQARDHGFGHCRKYGSGLKVLSVKPIGATRAPKLRLFVTVRGAPRRADRGIAVQDRTEELRATRLAMCAGLRLLTEF